MANDTPESTEDLRNARWELLEHITKLTDKAMIALAFVWLILLAIDLTSGLNRPLQVVSNAIWIIFIADFVIEFVIAPHKREYLRRNWLTALSLALPALRLLRVLRAFRILNAVRAVRTVSFLRLITSLNRSMRAVGNAFGRRNIGYLIVITMIVTFAGAAGMAYFESPQAIRAAGYAEDAALQGGLANYGDAVWWTFMLMTTIGSDYWPVTIEGRILCWILSVYALAIFGYITAAFASYFIGIDQNKVDRDGLVSDISITRTEQHGQ
jgi:voltage-gated potassium channel